MNDVEADLRALVLESNTTPSFPAFPRGSHVTQVNRTVSLPEASFCLVFCGWDFLRTAGSQTPTSVPQETASCMAPCHCPAVPAWSYRQVLGGEGGGSQSL